MFVRHRFLAFGLLASVIGCNCEGEELQKSFSELSVDPVLIDFGDVVVGDLRAKSLTVSNKGNAPLELTRLQLSGSPEIALAGPSPTSLPANGSVQLALAYQPTDEGLDETTLTVESNDGQGAKTVQLKGRGVRPGLTVDGDTPGCGGTGPSLSFGSVQVGVTADHELLIRASGTAPVEITGVEVTGASPFSVETFAGAIQPGETHTTAVHFTPPAAGPYQGQLVVHSPAGDLTVSLCGRAAGPALCARPVPLDFGAVGPGQSMTSTLTVESCGDFPLDLAVVEIADDPAHASHPGFTMSSLAPRTLVPGETIQVPVTFRSDDLGRKEGFIHASSNATGQADAFFPIVARVAPPCDLLVSPDRLNFPGVAAGATATKATLVANLGSDTCELTGAEITGATTFSLATAFTPETLGPGESKVVSVTYAPTSTSAAAESGLLTIHELAGPHPVNLEGNSTEPAGCALDFDPTVVNFGAQALRTTEKRVIRLRNHGDATCRISGVRLATGSPHFSATPPTLGFVLPGLGNSIDVEYHPRAAGSHFETLLVSVTAGANSETYSVALTGVGGDALLCVDPTELRYGIVPLGQTRDLTFTISSCGALDVSLRGLNLPPATRRNFAIVSAPNVPIVIPAGQSTQVTVRYAPGDAGPHLGLVELFSTNPTTPHVRLLGGAAPSCDKALDCAPAPVDFGRTEVGTTKPIRIVCTNVGILPVSMTNAVVAGSADLAAGFSSSTILPGESSVVEVRYSPADEGTDSGTLTLTTDACFGGMPISVMGEGYVPTRPPCIPPSTFSPVAEWTWTGSLVEPAMRNVWMTPLVANLTDDDGNGRIDENDIPEVIFTTFDTIPFTRPTESQPGVLRIVSGDTGAEILSVVEPRFAESAQLAVGDLDGDGVPEIIGSKWRPTASPGSSGTAIAGLYTEGTLVAVDPQGNVLWESEPFSWPNEVFWNASAPAIADLDGDGFAEVVLGREVFDRQGRIVWRGDKSMGRTAGGPHSVVADIDLDGRPDVVAGDTVYRWDGQVLWQATNNGRPLGDGGVSVGWLDVADTHPSVLIDTGNTLHAVDHTGAVRWSVSPSSRGPTATLPVLADFDGDGADEVAIADGKWAHIYDGDGTELWNAQAVDETCCPGVSAFDFEGDGAFELLLNDYGNVYVFRGATGQQIFIAPRPNQTNYEVPVVADVDRDGHAEIIVANDGGSALGSGPGGGITVYSNTGDNWVSAPPIWNQQSFHVGNIHPSGSVPTHPPRLNTPGTVFRGTAPSCEE